MSPTSATAQKYNPRSMSMAKMHKAKSDNAKIYPGISKPVPSNAKIIRMKT